MNYKVVAIVKASVSKKGQVFYLCDLIDDKGTTYKDVYVFQKNLSLNDVLTGEVVEVKTKNGTTIKRFTNKKNTANSKIYETLDIILSNILEMRQKIDKITSDVEYLSSQVNKIETFLHQQK